MDRKFFAIIKNVALIIMMGAYLEATDILRAMLVIWSALFIGFVVAVISGIHKAIMYNKDV